MCTVEKTIKTGRSISLSFHRQRQNKKIRAKQQKDTENDRETMLPHFFRFCVFLLFVSAFWFRLFSPLQMRAFAILKVGLHHLFDKIVEAHLVFPPQLFVYLGRIA